jgi:hypothetical protein
LPLARDFSIVAKLVSSARSRVGLTIEAAELSAISSVGGDVAALYPKTKRLGRVCVISEPVQDGGWSIESQTRYVVAASAFAALGSPCSQQFSR